MVNPDIYLFNPTCEMAIANNANSFIPKQYLKQFENDLSYLPSILAKNNDLIAVSEYEDFDFIEKLHLLGFPTPGQILKSELFSPQQQIISEISNFIPWGWSPNIRHQVNKIPQLSIKNKLPAWSEEERNIYSRKTALACLSSILESKNTSNYIPKSHRPVVLSNLDDVLDFIKTHKKVVLKEPWSSSGKGVIFIRKHEIAEGLIQRCTSILKQQGFIMGELIMDKVTDLSLHFYSNGNDISYVGESYFITNENGQYQANLINKKPDIKTEYVNFIELNKLQLKHDLKKALKNTSITKFYRGFFGIDIMLIKLNHKILFQPCVEINLRNNMGTIALHIEKYVHPDSKGIFHIVVNPKNDFKNLFNSWFEKLEFKNEKVIRGIIPLINPERKNFGAYIHLE